MSYSTDSFCEDSSSMVAPNNVLNNNSVITTSNSIRLWVCVGDDMGGKLLCFLSGVSVDVGCPCILL